MGTSKKPDPHSDIPEEYRPAEWLVKKPNRPPSAEKAISHRDVLYAAVGRVLTAWEILETILMGEFMRILKTDADGARVAWGSIVSSKARIDAIIAAAEVELQPDEFARVKRCMTDVNFLANTRNLIAHGVVYQFDGTKWISDDPRLDSKGLFALGPAPYNSRKMKPTAHYRFSLGEVEAVGLEIQKMWARVGQLSTGQYSKFWRLALR